MPGTPASKAFRRLQHDVEPLAQPIDFEAAELPADRDDQHVDLGIRGRALLAQGVTEIDDRQACGCAAARARAAPTGTMAARATLTVSTTASIGTPKTWPAASTVSTWVIITVNGRRSARRCRDCGRLDTETRPPRRSIARAHDIHPDAASGQVGDLGGRREAGSEDQLDDLVVGHGRPAPPRSDAACPSDLADPGDVDAAAVVLDLDHDPVALPRGAQVDRRDRRLAGRGAFGLGASTP